MFLNAALSWETVPSNMQKCTYSDNAQSIIRAFALHSYMPRYPTILFADSKGPDQTARMRRLIWDFAVRICPETLFRLARHNQSNRTQLSISPATALNMQ